MHRPRARSVSQMQDEEPLPNIDAHLDYINKLLKWSSQDLEHFITLLNKRLQAEEQYIASLERIERVPPVPEPEAPYQKSKFFGDAQSTFQHAVAQYELSLSRATAFRRELVKTMRTQIQVLQNVKENQENRRKKIKNIMGEKNTNYINYRKTDLVKRHKTYLSKCADLEMAQQSLAEAEEEHTEEHVPRRSVDSDHAADASSIGSAPASDNHYKRGMAGLVAMRTHLANVMSAVDASRSNAKVARLKREVVETDREYRKSVHFLERLRRKQIDTSKHAMKHVEVLFLDKADWSKSVLRNILITEHAILLKEASLVQGMVQTADEIDGRKDVERFNQEYSKLKFDEPLPIFYENHQHGRLKDVQFGVTLEGYHKIYGRMVPVLVEKCIQAVESMGGLQKEGIYRVSGRQSNVDALKLEFEKDEEAVKLDAFDVFTIASVLKVYLRELSEPLFPLPAKDRIEYSSKNEEVRLWELKSRLVELKEPHLYTLKLVIEHLARVSAHSDVNKMHLQNLSVIFTPAIFHDFNQAENPGEWCIDKVFEDLILHHKKLFAEAEAEKRAMEEAKNKQQQRQTIISPANKPLASLPPAQPPDSATASVASSTVYEQQEPSSVRDSTDMYKLQRKTSLLRKDSLRRPIPSRKDSLRRQQQPMPEQQPSSQLPTNPSSSIPSVPIKPITGSPDSPPPSTITVANPISEPPLPDANKP